MVAFSDDRGNLISRIAELEEEVASLQAEQMRTTIALAKSDVGIFDWNLENKQVYVSPAAQEMLGHHGGEGMKPDPTTWLDYVHTDDRYRLQADLREALMYGRETFKGLYHIVRTDGTTRLFLFRGIVFRRPRVEGGDATRILGTATDLTGVPGLA
jgi:PAS domain-containing protein